MAEQHDADRDDRDRDPQPIDEEAAWAAIVAGYGDEPTDPLQHRYDDLDPFHKGQCRARTTS